MDRNGIQPCADQFRCIEKGLNGNDSTRKAALEDFDRLYYKFYNRDYAPEVDRRIAKAMLKMYADSIAPEHYPAFFKTIDKKHKGNIGKYVDHLFESSLFADPQKYEKWKKRPNIKALEKTAWYNMPVPSKKKPNGSTKHCHLSKMR